MNNWSVVYKKAINDDGSLLFPKRLSKEFLETQRRSLGSYLFANQYQNEVIPEDEKRFKDSWLRYYKEIPSNIYNFAFVDPAIGQKNHHDYTGVAVVSVDYTGNWYLRVASRYRLTPSQIVDKIFEIDKMFKPKFIGIESVAFQEALVYITVERMKREKVMIPIKGVTRSNISKQSRILSLVPRFEWGGLMVAQGMTDFEDEYSTFPRGSYDDILDSIASIEEFVHYPQKEVVKLERPNSPADPNYEKWFISQLAKNKE